MTAEQLSLGLWARPASALARDGGKALPKNGPLHQRGRTRATREGGDHQHRGAEGWGGVVLDFRQGLLEEAPITDQHGAAAIAAP